MEAQAVGPGADAVPLAAVHVVTRGIYRGGQRGDGVREVFPVDEVARVHDLRGKKRVKKGVKKRVLRNLEDSQGGFRALEASRC